MDFKFDIFRRLPDGKPVWMEAVESLDEAKMRLNRLALVYPGEYFIYSLKDGRVIEGVTKSPSATGRPGISVETVGVSCPSEVK